MTTWTTHVKNSVPNPPHPAASKPGAGTPFASFSTAGGDELARRGGGERQGRGLGSRWGPVSELEIVSEDENCLCAAPGVDAVLKIQFNQGCARVSAAT